MSQMRFSIVDDRETISFLAPPHLLKAITAACAEGIPDARAMVTRLAGYDPDVSEQVLAGLAVFDEHVIAGDPLTLQAWIDRNPDYASRPFRVLDEQTRQQSLLAGDLGVVMFNLPARRIIQIVNSYANLQRRDLGRIRSDGRPTRQLYRYQLPDEWEILP